MYYSGSVFSFLKKFHENLNVYVSYSVHYIAIGPFLCECALSVKNSDSKHPIMAPTKTGLAERLQ
jgi:hypothetical protein